MQVSLKLILQDPTGPSISEYNPLASTTGQFIVYINNDKDIPCLTADVHIMA